MKKTFLMSVFLLASLAFTSCKKEYFNTGKGGDMMTEIASEEEIVTTGSSSYERIEAETLVRPDDNSPYSEGAIDYKENGVVTSSIKFGKNGLDKAAYKGKGGDKEVILKKDGKYSDKMNCYKKIIIEPLVKAEDCKYIVAGIVKLIDCKTGEWVATFDFGDGKCDDLVTKTTKNGKTTFSLKDLKK